MPLCGQRLADLRRGRAAGVGDRRPLHGSVHLRRTGHRLAGQQQHRRLDLRAARAGTVPRAVLGGGQRRYGRHGRDHRPVRPLPADADQAGGHGSRGFGVLRGLGDRRHDHHRRGLTDRGHRPSPGGAVLHPDGDRSDGPSPRRPLDRHHALDRRGDRPQRRRLDGHQRVGRPADHQGDAGARRAGERRHAHLRRRRTLQPLSDVWLLEQGIDIGPGLVELRDYLKS
jgi:hypothetical protein